MTIEEREKNTQPNPFKYKVKVDTSEIDKLKDKLEVAEVLCKRLIKLGISKRTLKRLIKEIVVEEKESE